VEREWTSLIPRWVTDLKSIAFTSNYAAKQAHGLDRVAHYERKARAINKLLAMGFATVESEPIWSSDDPILGIKFAGGGQLHTKISCLDLSAFRVVRSQLKDVRPIAINDAPFYPVCLDRNEAAQTSKERI